MAEYVGVGLGATGTVLGAAALLRPEYVMPYTCIVDKPDPAVEYYEAYKSIGRKYTILKRYDLASPVINSAIDVGNKTVVRAAEYLIDSTILYQKDYLVFEGEGQGTILKLKDGANVDVMAAQRRNNARVILRDFVINGNKANNTAGRGLVFTGYWSVLDNIGIEGCAQEGFVAQVPVGSWESMVDNFVMNIRTRDNKGDGFVWGTETGGKGTDNYFFNIMSFFNQGNGIDWKLATLYGWNINSYDNTGHGMIIRGAETKITQGEFGGNGRHGCLLYRSGGWRTLITGARAWNNSGEEVGVYDGFMLDGDGIYTEMFTTLLNCFSRDNRTPKRQRWGVNRSYLSATSRCLVIGGSHTENIQAQGINVDVPVLRAIGVEPLFENSGTATIPSGLTSVTVPHGLPAAPRTAFVTGTHAEVADAYVSARDATNIYITVPAPVTADRYVDWRAYLGS